MNAAPGDTHVVFRSRAMSRSFLLGLACAALAAGPAAPQERAAPLYDRALKAQSRAAYDAAIKLYERCLKTGDAAYASRASFQKALCHEAMEPPQLAEAKTAYEAVTDGDLAEKAKAKLLLAGVDVYLDRFEASVRRWRETEGGSTEALEKLKKETWEKIAALGLGAQAAPGLLWALGKSDNLVRDFAAEKLPEVVDADGIARAVDALKSPDPLQVAGVSQAIRRVLSVYANAAHEDKQADEMEKKLTLRESKLAFADFTADFGDLDKALGRITNAKENMPEDFKSRADKTRTQLEERRDQIKALAATNNKSVKEGADRLNQRQEELAQAIRDAIQRRRQAAEEIRKNIPKQAELGPVVETLRGFIRTTEARVEARVEGIRVAEELGDLEGPLVETLLGVLADESSEVRAEAARALGTVKKDAVEDRRKAAAKLEQLVAHEPEKVQQAGQEPDWKNNAFVRANAAFGLGQLGIVTSVPALIKALEDNDARVRDSAARALSALTGVKDIRFDADAAPAKRSEGQAAWQKWWEESRGVEVLVRRYLDFSNQWERFDTSLYYDGDYFMRRLRARLLILFPADAARREQVLKEADDLMKRFTREKDVLKNEVTALGPDVTDLLVTFLGGKVRGAALPHPSVRLFVAQCLAEIAQQDAGTKDKVRGALISGGTTPDQKAQQIGAAYALGLLGSGAGEKEKEALAKEGLKLAGGAIREAAARALGMLGAAGTSGDLIGATRDLKEADEADERALVAIADALGRIHDPLAGADLEALGKMAAASDSGLVRESACWALGQIAKPEGWRALVQARTDIYANVRTAAREAVVKLGQKHAALVQDLTATAAYREGGTNAAGRDRAGACLALGDAAPEAAQAEAAALLRRSLLDQQDPQRAGRKLPKDPDPSVRTAAAEALGELSLRAAQPAANARALVQALGDNAEEVRTAAFGALGRIAAKVNAGEPPKIGADAYDPKKAGMSAAAVQRFDEWITEKKAEFGE
jgi:HEAT repeat protein